MSEIVIVFIILAAAIIMFITEWIRMDLAALIILITLGITGIITVEEALAGFSSPAVIAVIGIFIMGAALEYNGVGTKVGKLFYKAGGNNEKSLIVIIMICVCILSSVMNNIAATTILFSGVMTAASSTKISPSKLLIPLAFGSSLGGMLTLIGTPPNLIVSSVLMENGFNSFNLFDFTPGALMICFAGILFMAFIGRKILPDIKMQEKIEEKSVASELAKMYRLNENLYQLQINENSRLINIRLIDTKLRETYAINVFAIIRGDIIIMQPSSSEKIRTNDKLLVTGSDQNIDKLASEISAEKVKADLSSLMNLTVRDTTLVEATLSPRSSFEGCTLREVKFRDRFNVNVVGIWRKGEPITSHIADTKLQLGDALLLQGPWNQFKVLKNEQDLILLSDAAAPKHIGKPWLAIGILIIAIIPAVFGLVPIALSALAGAIIMIISRCLPVEEAYKNVQWSAVFLMAGIIPLGTAINKTGAASYLADNVFTYVSNIGLIPLVIIFFILTMILCIFTSNVIAAVVMSPIAMVKAVSLGIDPHILMLTVAYASSTSFITPIAHQSNLLVMGAGGYKFIDYVRTGLPLSVIVMIVTVIYFYIFYI